MIATLKFLQLLLVLVFSLCETHAFGVHPKVGMPQIKCIEKERQALIKFKQGLTSMNYQLSSWETKQFQKDCCKWQGVHCHNRTGNVIVLNLRGGDRFSTEHSTGVISHSLLELKYLEHLDFSDLNFIDPIPMFFGSFTRLKYLRLSNVGFQGRIPHELGNLSSLHTLDLSQNNLFADNLEWLLPLQSLTNLYLDWTDLSNASDWLKSVNKLPLLRELHLFHCHLPQVTLSLMDSINSFTSLTVLDVSFNDLGSSIYTWLFNYTSSLSNISLAGNNLQGPISDDFAKMVSLVNLNLAYNTLEGGVPSYFSNYTGLKSLVCSGNNFMGHVSALMNNLSGHVSNTLECLDFDSNVITGSLPDTTVEFSSLRELNLGNNLLTGVLTESIGHLSNLEQLFLGSNHFEGAISESHMLNLSRLKVLDFSLISHLEFKFQSDWIPPFQLDSLNLRNCKIGPYFPKWLQSQKEISEIDMSTAEISGDIPNWFWNQMPRLVALNLSYNQISGTLSKLNKLRFVDLSSSDFKGLVPQLSENASLVNLSKNRFLL